MGFVKRALRIFSSFFVFVLGWRFVLERFLFRLWRSFRQPDLLFARGVPVPGDLFGRKRNERGPIYQSGSVQLTQGRAGRAPFQKL